MRFTDPVVTLSVEQRVKRIASTIREEEKRLREKYLFLKFQNLIGLGIMLMSLVGMVTSGWLYYIEAIPAWGCILASAFFASLSHELEHDLIHQQYFRHNIFMHNMMMFVVWIMRPNTVHPWYRRDIHFLHHKTSGTEQDLEERLVGNGVAYGVLRYLVMFDGLLGMLTRAGLLKKEVKRFNLKEILFAAFPFATFYFATWYFFLGFHAYDFLAADQALYPLWFLSVMDVINFLVVVLIAPNFVRSGCLNFITSNMHYYGGVTNLIQQTQVLKPWFLMPLQFFCFNFGSTHGIHHFVVGQPFYLRQMVAKAAHKVMKENGVRFDDFSTFLTNNRYKPSMG